MTDINGCIGLLNKRSVGGDVFGVKNVCSFSNINLNCFFFEELVTRVL